MPSKNQNHISIQIQNTFENRELEPVFFKFEVPRTLESETTNHLLFVEARKPLDKFLPIQFFNLNYTQQTITGEACVLIKFNSKGYQEFHLYFQHDFKLPTNYNTSLEIRSASDDKQHNFIENQYYKVETLPKSGQIWHMWNKLGTNKSWHHNEWDDNIDKGGDPCHWAPNCWIGHPDRIAEGYELHGGQDINFIDWHYVFGWDNPKTTITTGPVFHEIKRSGIVWPHPEHMNDKISYDQEEKISAEVTYRFYNDIPWIYQSSTQETLTDVPVFFIRNSQFVFLTGIFSHVMIAPEAKDLLPEDFTEPAILKLMADVKKKPFYGEQHSLSNVLPAKLDYYSFYNHTNGDGFAQFQCVEENTNIYSGIATLNNHCNLLTELSGWSTYFCRAFSYTNQRFNPENMSYLPKGEKYYEENNCLIYRHESVEETKEYLAKVSCQFKQPLTIISA